MSRRVRKPRDELEELANRSTVEFGKAMRRLASAEFTGNEEKRRLAINRIKTLTGESMALADLFGRRRVLLQARTARPPRKDEPLMFDETPVVPGVTFRQAVEDLVSRVPLFGELDPTGSIPLWKQVANLYKERHAFALARDVEGTVTKRVQNMLASSIKKGQTLETTVDLLTEFDGFSRAYAENVYRTNLSTAYTAGTFKQLEHPSVSEVIGALQFVTSGDEDVRDNHKAANGITASPHDPVWNSLSPPLGYQCRCSLRTVDRQELKRMGLINREGKVSRKPARIPSKAKADNGFGKSARTDRSIYG